MDAETPRHDAWGEPTCWSLIERAAGQRPDADVQRAWRELLARYRAPVAQSVRRAVRNHARWKEAADDFFVYLFDQELLPRVERDQGRFRCYMQGVIRRYAQHWLRTEARGPAVDLDELELGTPEEDPEFVRAEESAWAETLLGVAVQRLAAQHPREAEFLLRAYGIAPYAPATREELCAELGVNANQLNVAIHRARGWLRECVLAEIRELVSDTDQLDDEQAFLLGRLQSAHPGLCERAAGAAG